MSAPITITNIDSTATVPGLQGGGSARWKRLSREIVWILVGQSASALGGLIGVRILTGRLSPPSYGELALAMTVVMVVQQALTGPLSQATLRFYAPSVDGGDFQKFMATLCLLQTKVSLLAVAVGIPVAFCITAGSMRHYFAPALLALAISIITGVNGTLDAIQTAARHRSVVALHQGASQWARPLGAWIMTTTIASTSAMALCGYLAASCAVLVSQLSQFRRRFACGFLGTVKADAEYTREFLTYAWPFSAWGLFTALQLGSDRWILSFSLDNRSVGIYTVASQLGYSPLAMISGAATVFISPVLFSRAGDGSDPRRVEAALKLNRQLLLLVAAMSGFAAVATYFLRHTLIRLMCAPGYEEAGKYLPWLVIAAGLFACGQIASLAMLIRRDTKGLIAPKIATGILAFVLYVLGARAAGIYGVVGANIGFALVYCLWILRLAGRHNRPPNVNNGQLGQRRLHSPGPIN
jgi:O-antigen/teichoic acid export membrane protein